MLLVTVWNHSCVFLLLPFLTHFMLHPKYYGSDIRIRTGQEGIGTRHMVLGWHTKTG